MDTEMAAMVIQKIFRGYKTRLAAIRADKQELIFLRMAVDDLDGEDEAERLEKDTRVRRKTIQKDFQRLYLEHTDQMKSTLYEDEGPEVREDFATKVSDWYFNFRVQYKQWPEEVVDFLDDEKNGTKMPDVPEEGADDGKKKDKKEKKKKGRKKDDDEFEKSEFLQQIQDSTLWYSSLWERRDEADNFEQKHDPEIIKSALRPEIHTKVQGEALEKLGPELTQAQERFEDAIAAVSKKK